MDTIPCERTELREYVFSMKQHQTVLYNMKKVSMYSEGGLPICIEECYREALVHKIFSLGAIIFAFVATKLLMTQSQGHQQDMGLTTVKSLNLLKEYSS